MTALFLKYVFVILHIITAAAWFGLGLRLAARARLTLNLDRAAALALAEDTRKTLHLMGIFIVLTFLFSLAAFFLGGGFSVYGPQYHTSLLLIVLLVLLQYLLLRPAWSGLQTLLENLSGTADEAASYRKRIAMGIGIGHLIWLILLVLMFWNQLTAPIAAA